ncbi:hypothetical protein DPMN_046929 [Dreissena polymorpha]|uniref:Uncharacterized protein n=1 Tax=Dreissena polymorpha TaxID=45954 RepID=A0A9D4HYN1_DREPO|nr:hypothetical protein DPMN_046929 [Dreissena polymorpha]
MEQRPLFKGVNFKMMQLWGQRCHLKAAGNHLCEILQLADTKDALDQWERVWSNNIKEQDD